MMTHSPLNVQTLPAQIGALTGIGHSTWAWLEVTDNIYEINK